MSPLAVYYNETTGWLYKGLWHPAWQYNRFSFLAPLTPAIPLLAPQRAQTRIVRMYACGGKRERERERGRQLSAAIAHREGRQKP